MNDQRFVASSWKHASERITEIRSVFQAESQEVLYPSTQLLPSPSVLDMASAKSDELSHHDWYNVCGNMVTKLNSDASKFMSTAVTYQATEDTNEMAAKRMWSY